MDKNVLENLRNDLEEIKDKVFAILIYGSYVTGEAHSRSDIDICFILKTGNKEIVNKIFKKILEISAKNEKYDIRIFEQMPLFMKIEVIENGEVIYAEDLSELNEYFYFFRKLWQDQSINWIDR